MLREKSLDGFTSLIAKPHDPVALTGPYAGRLVALDPAVSCRRCEMCEAGHRNLCPTVRFAGHSSCDGGLREYLAWPDEQLHPVPDDFTPADAAVLEPLGVALHAWDLGHARVGASVGIVGAGPIGLLTVQLARAAGAGRIYVVEPLEHRRRAARDLGADAVLSPEMADAETWRELTGLGCDLVLEFAGNDDGIATAFSAARPGARVLLGGIPSDDRSSFQASLARRKGLTIGMVRRMKEMYPRAIELVDSGRVDLGAVVSAVEPLTRANEAFQGACERRGLKVIIDPGA